MRVWLISQQQYRFIFLATLSVAVMIIDHRSDFLQPVRTISSSIMLPFQLLVRLPGDISAVVQRYYPDDGLYFKYEKLRQAQFILNTRLQKFEALVQENLRLSQLLSASRKLSEEALLANMVEIGLDSNVQQVVINRGVEAGVFVGQPAIAPSGVIGQVSKIGLYRSVITLITDRSHALPVQIQRNGLRTIMRGGGANNPIKLPFLLHQADIRKGDILVTSGMGQRFPFGYKVAEVAEVVKDANEPFLRVNAVPTANIDYAKEVLLLWNKPVSTQENRSTQ